MIPDADMKMSSRNYIFNKPEYKKDKANLN